MKTTILGGLLFLVPLAVLAIVIGKAYQISMLVADPIDNIVPVESIAGVAFANLVAIALILLVCYLVGMAAKWGVLGSRIEHLDGFLIDMIPGYAVTKGMLGSVAKDDDIASLLTPVIVSFDDYDQIAFEVEHNDTKSVLFLPGSPSAWSGSTVVADRKRVHPLNIPTHQAVKLMRVLGRGTLEKPSLTAAE